MSVKMMKNLSLCFSKLFDDGKKMIAGRLPL